jgi:hypothetical protein
MRLAEALILRSDCQKRLEQLRQRLLLCVKVQEGLGVAGRVGASTKPANWVNVGSMAARGAAPAAIPHHSHAPPRHNRTTHFSPFNTTC